MEKMRATRMVEVGRMECEEIEIPRLVDGQVMVRSEMASICGSDLHVVMMGAGLGHPCPCPHGYPGHEGIGIVVESKSVDLSEGTHVLTFPNPPVGECFNEYQRIGPSYCVPLPGSDLPRSQLMMAQQLGTVLYAMNQNPCDVQGKTVVVMGQGSAGLFWTYLLKRAGAERVITSDLSDTRLDVSQKYGADVCVNARQEDFVTVVNDLTQGEGADYVVEAVGCSETFLQSVDLVRRDGELMWFGLPSVDDNIPFQFQKFFRKRLKAISDYGSQDEPGAASFREALRLISEKEIDVAPLLSHIFSVEDIDKAMHLAHAPQDAGALKVSIHFE